jgi:hypothetical protein
MREKNNAKITSDEGTTDGVRTPDPKDFIPHYWPAMRPTLACVYGTISLRVFDKNGHMGCLMMSERDLAELMLQAAQVQAEMARHRLNAGGEA